MASLFNNKSVMVTGACGTVGSELVRQLLTDPKYAPREVIGIDHNETQLFFLDHQYLADPRARFFVADVCDGEEMMTRMTGVDIVIHAAAMKHVILSERSPNQVVQTNIIGVQNVIAAATANGVERVLFTSSDKAVNSTNVMGASKLMGERLMTAANSCRRGRGTIFASTRFGNVLGSNGSVVPIFRQQISQGGPVTLTSRDMSRFVMSVADAASLVIRSCELACGGEVFVSKMPTLRIADLAQAMIEELAPGFGRNVAEIKVEEIGIKPGEKLYEGLMSGEETRRCLELESYFVVLPAFTSIYGNIDYVYPDLVAGSVEKPYVSAEETPMSITEIRDYLRAHVLDQPQGKEMGQRYWPGDKEEKLS